jgi:Pentapeptide repeats (8 copies)
MAGRQRPWWLWALASLVALAALAGIILAVWKLPSLLYGDVTGASADARVQAASGFRTALVAGLAGLAALGSLVIATRTYWLTQQGQITERYTKATEQLGSDKLDVRLGGIYALERIAKDSERDHRTVVEVLSAFVREHSDPAHTDSEPSMAKVLSAFLEGDGEPAAEQPDSKPKPTTDVRAAVSVLGRLPSRLNVPGVDLSRVDFAGAALSGANLSGFRLTGADLEGADLEGADLEGADLRWAKLPRAYMRGANLQRANLRGANLRWANLWEANLWEANLQGANLKDAYLRGANLHRVDLTTAQGLTREQLTSSLLDAGTLPLRLRESDSTETRPPEGQ